MEVYSCRGENCQVLIVQRHVQDLGLELGLLLYSEFNGSFNCFGLPS
jgi:hypothetical protein